ncbi:MAG: DUF2461 domain-containing protein [Deltaproteobacteria bacterium]|nr:DUF2461 domain-containing protein [Deltaproteobacteria bacterium]
MSKEWFVENKLRYQSVWVGPMQALLRDVSRGLSPIYKPFALAEPGVLRIHRDLRFSRDKTPYKTHIAAVVRLAGDPVAEAGNAALYFQVGLDEEYAGVGCYRFDAERTARWRKAVVGAPGRTLLRILASLRDAGYVAGGYEHYVRPPKGFAPDHPRAELLKYKGLVCRFPAIPGGLLHKPELAGWLLAHGKATAPLVIWLRRHLG